MADPYPFKGIWRWVVLPSLLALAGLLASVSGGLAGGAASSDLGFWMIQGFVKSAVEGGALAVGRRPSLAVIAALILGALIISAEQELLTAAYGRGWGLPNSLIGAMVGYGAMSVLMILAHHLYLRLRRRGRWTALAASLSYPAAAIAGMGIIVCWIYPNGSLTKDLVLWAAAEGLLAWGALVVAARLSERVPSSATV